MLTVSLLLACSSSATIKLDGDGAPDEADADTDADSDSDTDADSDADSDSDADADSDSDTDTGTRPPPPEDALYTGVVEMTITYGGSDWQDSYDCTGEFDLTVTPEGVGTGTASCGDRDYTVDGPLEGVAQPGSFTGTWTIDVGRDTYTADVHGLLTESDATFDVALEDWGFTATGTMTGTRAR